MMANKGGMGGMGGKGDGVGDMTGMGGKGGDVFIGDLPVGITAEVVQPIFEAHGEIKFVKILAGRGDTACAIVKFVSHEVAESIVENVNGTTPEGLPGPITCRIGNHSAAPGKGSK